MPIALASGVGLAAATAAASGPFSDSRYLEPIPDYGSCDVTVSPANAATALAQLNNPSVRVFCVQPGDYRNVDVGTGQVGMLDLSASGTQQSPRFLRYAGSGRAIEQSQRALFETIRIRGSWWVIQGLTLQPKNPATYWFLNIAGGDHNVLDGNLVDGIEHLNPTSGQAGIVVGAWNADPATYNSVQANVVRNGNQSRQAVDYTGIAVTTAYDVGGDNDFNKILDNEVYDWGDDIALASDRPDCNFPAQPHGTVIDGNDAYLTGNKRIDCLTGNPDPNGDCACAENGIDLKPDPGSDPTRWTLVTNNRVWGWRPTRNVSTCGGSSARGQAISSGNTCPGHVLVANNVVLDSTMGVEAAGASWIIAGNLFYDIRTPVADRVVVGEAIATLGTASGLDIEFNTVVDVDNAYDDMSSDTDTRCNAILDDLGLDGHGGPRGANHTTAYNFIYASPNDQADADSISNFIGAPNTNQFFATDAASQDTTYCFWRKRWTAPEMVCVPLGTTTAASPHAQAAVNCHPDLAAPFGLATVGYPVPEPAGALLEVTVLVALAAFARWKHEGRPGD